MLRYAVAIDVGVKNLGVCIYDFVDSCIVHWKNVSLVPNGRYMPMQNVNYVMQFIASMHSYFDQAAIVVIERQMRCNMRIIESVLHALFFERCVIVAPRAIKCHYDLSTKNYRQNKARAVEWASEFIDRNANAFAPGVAEIFDERKSKRDDLADALLILMYYLDTYSNALRVDYGDTLLD